MHLTFDGPYGVYHSVYDTYRCMATQCDPGFRYTAAMARYAGVLALRFANADLLPYDASAYCRAIARYARDLAELPGADPLARELRLRTGRSRGRGGAPRALTSRSGAAVRARRAPPSTSPWLLSPGCRCAIRHPARLVQHLVTLRCRPTGGGAAFARR